MFRGCVVHCLNFSQHEILNDAVMVIDGAGKIADMGKGCEVETLCHNHGVDPKLVVQLQRGQFLMPGLVDAHTHAPQFVFTGTGMDVPLLEWLQLHTFPAESKFGDVAYAKDMYTRSVAHLLRQGTTTACYFGSIHWRSNAVLADVIHTLGQRALVGKVCMDRNAPSYYIESTANSLADTESFIQHVRDLGSPLVLPIITPRFVPTCTSPLMAGLGQLAKQYGTHIQSHLAENKAEIELVRKLHPEQPSYTHVYDAAGLLTPKTVMAHCIHLSQAEIDLMRQREAAVVHCPSSNFSICSGVLNVRRLVDEGVKVGLGTDVAGGYSPSMFDAIRHAILASKVTQMQGDSPHLSVFESLYLATLGSSTALGLEKEIGNFQVGKSFDALLVDTSVADSPVPVFERDTLDDIISKFIFLGDDRNIIQVFVAGKIVHRRRHPSL